MDTAVALVQAYLQINGYFTVCEYPVLETRRRQVRTATDLDVLAFRFPGAGREMARGKGRRMTGPALYEPDPELGCPAQGPDMIVGEVKESRARFNPAARDPAILSVALARFGCCPADHAEGIVSHLLQHGRAETSSGHTVRMVAFGGQGEPSVQPTHRVVPLRHVAAFVRAYIDEHWDVLSAAQVKLPALDLLTLLRKCRADPHPGSDEGA